MTDLVLFVSWSLTGHTQSLLGWDLVPGWAEAKVLIFQALQMAYRELSIIFYAHTQHIHTYTCMHVHAHISTLVHTCAHTRHVCTHMHTHTRAHSHTHKTCMHTDMHAHTS